jgi:hypothetical protein
MIARDCLVCWRGRGPEWSHGAEIPPIVAFSRVWEARLVLRGFCPKKLRLDESGFDWRRSIGGALLKTTLKLGFPVRLCLD